MKNLGRLIWILIIGFIIIMSPVIYSMLLTIYCIIQNADKFGF
jgi:hypothetical protein